MNQNLRILVVDDDRRMTRTLADILSMSGHEVVEVFSGPDALEKVRTMTFDCVLTDVKMPEMNGVELHRQLREAQPGLPVVLMTAYAADALISQGLEEGVIGVFDKPLDMNQLLSFFISLSRNRVIVVVDDDTALCQMLGGILKIRGFNVELVTEPRADMELMEADAQVLLLDMKLDVVGELGKLKEIRKGYPTLPVLLITGHRHEMANIIQGALDIDAFISYLYKPLDIPQLLETLAKLQVKRLKPFISSEDR